MQTLASHFLPAVSELVNKVMTPETIFSNIELDLHKYLDIDDDHVSYHAIILAFCIKNVLAVYYARIEASPK